MAKTVLVVDDDPTQRRLIQAVLERDGFAVSHAQNGDEAIQHLSSGAGVDVVLTDRLQADAAPHRRTDQHRSAVAQGRHHRDEVGHHGLVAVAPVGCPVRIAVASGVEGDRVVARGAEAFVDLWRR